MRDNTGDGARRTHNLNLANWVPDLFMKRVEEDGLWSLFDPKVVPQFPDLYGEEFESAYVGAEAKKLYSRQVKAREFYLCFAACIEGLFFFAAFAYVYFLRSKGLLNGLAAGTNWVFRDESAHLAFAFEVIATIRREEAELFDAELELRVGLMIEQAIECELSFAEDLLSQGIAGLSLRDMRAYLEFIVDQRLAVLRMPQLFGSRNPFSFMNLQDVQELTNFFERRASAYQIGINGEVAFGEEF